MVQLIGYLVAAYALWRMVDRIADPAKTSGLRLAAALLGICAVVFLTYRITLETDNMDASISEPAATTDVQ